MTRSSCLLPLACGLLVASLAGAEVKSTVAAVRVYQGQALVTRVVTFDAVAGPQEVVVADLPERIAPESLYANGDANLTIRAVRYRATAVPEATRAEAADLDRQLLAARDELNQLLSEVQTTTQQSQYLDRLEGFVAPTAQVELSRGVLDSRQLVAMTEFIFKQRADVSARRVDQAKRQKRVSETIALLERRRKELAASGPPQVREAVLFVDAAAAKPAVAQLSYLVGGATWAPAYLARLGGQRDKLGLEYQGVVAQTTGEDWTNVALTLSTSRPHMAANAPALAPLSMELVQVPTAVYAGAGQLGPRPTTPPKPELKPLPPAAAEQTGYDLLGATIVVGDAAALPDRDPFGDDFDVNIDGGRKQLAELASADVPARPAGLPARAQSEGLAVDYAIAGRSSLRSRSDQQTFRIAQLDLPIATHYTASPLVSDFVYLAGLATNTSETTLLAGPYSAYLDGAFAGRGRLPVVAKGEQVTMGFGTEPQLRATRELLDKKTEVRGGNKVVTLTYQMRLRNFMGRAVKARLWDRAPQAPNKQVTVSVTSPTVPLSEDALYLQAERPRGLLRWDVEAPVDATGRGLVYTWQLRLEFDKQLSVAETEQLEAKMADELEARRAVSR